MPIGKCKDCGFLSIYAGDGFYEVNQWSRDNMPSWRSTPVCFVRAATFTPDMTGKEPDAGGQIDMEGAYAAEMTKERDCKRFRKWDQGFSPKEHVEMHLMEMQEKREDRRDFWQKIELAILGIGVPVLMIVVQFVTTRMMMSAQMDATKMQIDAAAKASVDAHLDARIRQDTDL